MQAAQKSGSDDCGDRHQREQITIRRFEVNAAAATPVVQLGVVAAPGRAP